MHTLPLICRRLSAWLQVLLGTALTAAAFGLVVIPQGFAAGGVTGLARLLQGAAGLPLSRLVLGLNLALLALGLWGAGAGFVGRTLAASLVFPLLLEGFSRLPCREAAPFLSALCAGAVLGTGAGLVLRGRASTGGFDIPAVVLNRKLRLPVAAVMNGCDAAVILAQSVGQPLSSTLYGLEVILVSGFFVRRLAPRC